MKLVVFEVEERERERLEVSSVIEIETGEKDLTF